MLRLVFNNFKTLTQICMHVMIVGSRYIRIGTPHPMTCRTALHLFYTNLIREENVKMGKASVMMYSQAEQCIIMLNHT